MCDVTDFVKNGHIYYNYTVSTSVNDNGVKEQLYLSRMICVCKKNVYGVLLHRYSLGIA